MGAGAGDVALEPPEQRRVGATPALQIAGPDVVDPAERAALDELMGQRDRRDASRTDGPLMRPPGAVMIDTGDEDADAVVTRLETIVREQLADVLDPA